MCYGLTTNNIRKAAFTYASALKINYSSEWDRDRMAGIEWLKHFRGRHIDLRLKKPEGCSLSRATSFNKHNVGLFFDNLNQVFQNVPELGNGLRIYNLDETGLSTVQTPQKVLADVSIRRLNAVTSAERGDLVTAACIISSTGTYVPPVMIFPRKNFKNHMIRGSPTGTLGLANPCGWMTSDLFVDVLKHFVKHTNSSQTAPTLLIYDNHESHMNPVALKFAKDNGVHIITLPPHCSDKMQPLDVSVFRSLKASFNAAVDNWLTNHPGQTASIYEVAEFFGEAFTKSMTPSNIKSGFKSTGIFPFDRDVFSEDLFLCSLVTDRLPQKNEENVDDDLEEIDDIPIEPINNSATSSTIVAPTASDESVMSITAIDCLGIPKAGARKNTRKGRKRGRSKIVTSTPELNTLEEKANKRNAKLKQLSDKGSNPRRKLQFGKKTKSKVVKEAQSGRNLKREIMKKNKKNVADQESFSSDLLEDDVPLSDLVTPLALHDFVLVKFVTEEDSQVRYYVGQIIQLHENAYELAFLRKWNINILTNEMKFRFPDKPDVTTVHENQIIQRVLPIHRNTGTARQNCVFTFNFAAPPNLC